MKVTGEPNGVLKELAINLLENHVPHWTQAATGGGDKVPRTGAGEGWYNLDKGWLHVGRNGA